MIKTHRRAIFLVPFGYIVFLLLTGCDTTATVNDLMQLGSQAAQDKVLLEALVKDLKASPQTPSISSTNDSGKAVPQSPTKDLPRSEAQVQALQAMYTDTVAAQHSLLTVLSFGAGRAKQSELEHAAAQYEGAANRFLRSAVAEVATRYSPSDRDMSWNAMVAGDLPKIQIDRPVLSRAFAVHTSLRTGMMANLKTNMMLAPWSDL